MKILMINNTGSRQGGAEAMLAVLMRELKKRGHQVRLLAGDEKSEEKSFADATFKSFSARSPLRFFYVFNPYALWALRRELRRFRPDVVHLHNVSKASPFLLALLKDRPTVVTVHDHTWLDPTRFQDVPPLQNYRRSFADYFIDRPGWRFYLERFRFLCLKRWARHVDRTLCCSDFYRDCVRSSGILPQVSTLHNGIELGTPRAMGQKKRVLFAGRLSEDKGAHIFLGAAEKLRTLHPDAVFTIAGSGEQEVSLRNFIDEHQLQNQVELLGHQGEEEMKKLYAQAALVVVPSLHPDNLPTVCIEAMAAARPVLASDLGGLPELVEDEKTGLLLPPGDVDAWAEGIDRLLRDFPLRQRLGEAGREKAQKEFNVTSYIERTMAEYLNLTHQHENPNH